MSDYHRARLTGRPSMTFREINEAEVHLTRAREATTKVERETHVGRVFSITRWHYDDEATRLSNAAGVLLFWGQS